MIGKKTIELFNNQSGATNLYWPPGFRCVSIELHCGDVLWTNFDPVNFCPFDTFFEKHTRANKLKIELEVVTLSTGEKICITIQTSLLNADSAVFDDSSRCRCDVDLDVDVTASKCLNPISFAQARKCCIIPNSTKVLIMWLAGKMRHIPCSHWLTEEAR